MERYGTYARNTVERWGLRCEEFPGSGALIASLLHGPWDRDSVVARPGETIFCLDFRRD